MSDKIIRLGKTPETIDQQIHLVEGDNNTYTVTFEIPLTASTVNLGSLVWGVSIQNAALSKAYIPLDRGYQYTAADSGEGYLCLDWTIDKRATNGEGVSHYTVEGRNNMEDENPVWKSSMMSITVEKAIRIPSEIDPEDADSLAELLAQMQIAINGTNDASEQAIQIATDGAGRAVDVASSAIGDIIEVKNTLSTVAETTGIYNSTGNIADYDTGAGASPYINFLNDKGTPVVIPAGSSLVKFYPLGNRDLDHAMGIYFMTKEEGSSKYKVIRALKNVAVTGDPIAIEMDFTEDTYVGIQSEKPYSLRYSYKEIDGIQTGYGMAYDTQGNPVSEGDEISPTMAYDSIITWGLQVSVARPKIGEDRIAAIEKDVAQNTKDVEHVSEMVDALTTRESVHTSTGDLADYDTGLSSTEYMFLLNKGGEPCFAEEGMSLVRFFPLGATDVDNHYMSLYLLRKKDSEYEVYDVKRNIHVTGQPIDMDIDFHEKTYFAVSADTPYSLRYTYKAIDGIPSSTVIARKGIANVGDRVSFDEDASVIRTFGIELDIGKLDINLDEYARTYVVAKDGSGDFTRIYDAVKSVPVASKNERVKIIVRPGTYYLTEELGDLTQVPSGAKWYDVGIVLPPYVDLIGEGEVNIRLMPEASRISSTMAGLLSAINVRGENKLENLHIEVKNCRYAVHDESSGLSQFYRHKRLVKNCTFIHHGNDEPFEWQATCAYGCGFGVGDTIEMENCKFVTHSWDYGALFHDREATDEPTRITLSNCTFVTKSKNSVKFSSTVAKIARHKVLIKHCNVANIDNIEEVPESGVGLNYDIEVIGEPCTMRTTTASSDTAILTIRGWQEPTYSANALTKGKRYVYDGAISRFTEATGTRFDIIPLEDISENGTGIVFKGGYLPLTMAGLSSLAAGEEVYYANGQFTTTPNGPAVGRYDGIHTDYAYIYLEREPKAELRGMISLMNNEIDGLKSMRDDVNALKVLKDDVDDLRGVRTDVDTLKRTWEFEAASFCQELEVDEEGLVYLLNNGERIAGPYGPFAGSGGGGGGGNSATLMVTNETGWLSRTIGEGEDCAVTILWSSIEDNMPTGDGTAKITVNGVVKGVLNIQQGTTNIDLTKYLSAGSNIVKVNIADVYGNNRTINFSITSVQISISSPFDASTPYQGSISFPFTPTGSVEKTVHFLLDGREIGTTTTSVSGRQLSFTIPQQSHGAHKLECYFDCEINGQQVKSNRLYFEIICLEPMNSTPIIVSSFNRKEAAQYTVLNVDYTVYDPANATSNVTISVNGTQAAAVTVDRTQHTFSYRASKAGALNIVIRSGSASKNISLTITESEVDVEAETDQLKLFLSSAGRSNNEANPGTWTYENISAAFAGFDWTSDGWQADEEGIPVLRIKGGASLTIPYKVFANDFRNTGKTIELEFATRDILDYDVTICSCISGGRGLTITPQRATLKSEQSEISMQYKEDEHIRVAFVIEKRAENRLILTYINGIASGAIQYPDNDDFSQVSPVNISMGSDKCTLDLYCIRVYDNDLTRHQILDNWIADTQDITQMLDRWRHNQVYDAYGKVVIDKLPGDLPHMIISCAELPQYKGDKKTVSIAYTDPLFPANSFEAQNCQANVQGTSSAPYARKNYDLQFKSGFDMSTGHVDNYKLRSNSIPFNRFVLKADVASSEAVNNTGLVSLFNDTNPYKTKEMLADPRVRHGIDGFPIVVFWHNTKTNETGFLGKYNFNLPKRAAKPYGYSGNMESWEWQNNTSDRVLFKSDDFEAMYTDIETGETYPEWRNDFEARFPSDEWVDITKLRELLSWVKSTDRNQATGSALPAPVAYGSGDDIVTYTNDTAAYRLAKFKAECADRVEMDSAYFYYIFTELFLMVDSRAKNMFLGFKGSPVTISGSAIDRKAVFEPYDMDTALGTNNEGALTFGYSLEDTDHLPGGADIFNGQDSVFWCNLRDAFQPEIVRMYQSLRSTGKLSYESVETMYEQRQAKWPEAVWNEDAWFKYIDPLIAPDPGKTATAFYLPMMQGSKAEQRKWWLYNRFRYMDSKWNAGDALKDVIQLRGYAKANISVTPYADIYPTIKYGSYLVQTRGQHGVTSTLACPLDNVNDTEIYIYSAPQLASIGDLSGLKVGLCDVSLATKLQSLKVGDASSGYENPNLTELTLGNNVLLTTLDVRNCTGLTQPVDISNCTNIEKIYFEGTKTTGVKLPNGGILNTLHLPATITNLEVRNQSKLTDIVIGGYSNITSIWIENPSDALEAVFNTALDSIASGARLRAVGLTLEMADAAAIRAYFDKLDRYRGMDEYGNNMDKAQVSGTIHTPFLTGADLAEFNARYPYLRIQADHTRSNLYYYNYDGSELLYTEAVEDGGDGAYAGTPTREAPSAQNTFEFVGWNTKPNQTEGSEDATKAIVADRKVYAAYTLTGPTFTVYFYNGETLLETVDGVLYGGSASYGGSTPSDGVAEDYFTGWSPEPVNITADTSCYAQYATPPEHTITDSWAEFIGHINDGTYADRYSIGDTIPLYLGDEGYINMEIAAFDADELADGSGYAPVTMIAYHVLNNDRRMNPTFNSKDPIGTGAIGGWVRTELRAWLKEDLLPRIPENISGAIKPVTKYTHTSANYKSGTTTSVLDMPSIEDIWIPSAREVGMQASGNATVETKGPIYPITHAYNSINNPNTNVSWWTRTRSTSDVNQYFVIRSNIGTGSTNCYSLKPVLIGFCLGKTE